MSVKMHAYLERVYDHEDAMHPDYTLLAKLTIVDHWDIYSYFGFGDFMGPLYPVRAVACDYSLKLMHAHSAIRQNFGATKVMEANLEMLEQIKKAFQNDKPGTINHEFDPIKNQIDPIIGILREITKTPNTTGRLVFWFEF